MADAPCKIGDRIRLIQMPDDPDPIPEGTTGTVLDVHRVRLQSGYWQVSVKWDIDRSLSVVVPPDVIEIL